MGILRPLRNLIWDKGLLNREPTELDPVESPHRSQICATVVTFNIGEAIRRCVDSIQSQVGHVLIVDNGSDVQTRRELKQLASSASVTLILNERNEGVARACNQAVRRARDKGFQGAFQSSLARDSLISVSIGDPAKEWKVSRRGRTGFRIGYPQL